MKASSSKTQAYWLDQGGEGDDNSDDDEVVDLYGGGGNEKSSGGAGKGEEAQIGASVDCAGEGADYDGINEDDAVGDQGGGMEEDAMDDNYNSNLSEGDGMTRVEKSKDESEGVTEGGGKGVEGDRESGSEGIFTHISINNFAWWTKDVTLEEIFMQVGM